MKRIVRCLAAAATFVAALAATASGGALPTSIQFGDTFFDPKRAPVIATQPGQPEAVWERASGSILAHNVRQDDRLFRSGAPRGPAFTGYDVDLSAGTYHYYCENHGSPAGGMNGLVRVRPAAGGASPATEQIVWGDAQARRVDRYLVQFRAQGSRWRTWKRKTRRLQGIFGKQDQPISPQLGATYQVRVRSFVAKNPPKGSRFSPPVSFVVDDEL